MWERQFVEGVREVTRQYARFEATCDLDAYDRAVEQHESLNEAYGLSLDLLDYEKLGRSLVTERDLPNT